MPKERCVRRCAAHKRLWEPGEMREIEEFDEDGAPVISDHFRLVEDDEEFDPELVQDGEELRERRREVNERDKHSAVMRALDELDPSEDRHWTQSGLPSMQEIHLRTDLELTRSEVHEIAPDFDRDSHREAQKLEAETRERAAG